MKNTDTVHIDGATGEGGGQIIRTAVALAAITGKPTELVRIRARRSRPGLQAQHLTAVKAAAALCKAELNGAELGSQYLRFIPTTAICADDYAFDVAEAKAGGSAGATGLVLQTVALPLALTTDKRPGSVTISGGTHVPMSPSADFIERIYLPALMEMGVSGTFQNERAGFFPKGGGAVNLSLQAPLTQGIDRTERGKLRRFLAVITTSELPQTVAERGAVQLQKELRDYGVPILPVLRFLPSVGAGASVLLVAECDRTTEGWQSLGERGKSMESVASEAAKAFKKWYPTGCGTDQHLADQLALPAALAPGNSSWTTSHVSEHLRTVIQVIQQFLPVEIQLTENENGTGSVTVLSPSSMGLDRL